MSLASEARNERVVEPTRGEGRWGASAPRTVLAEDQLRYGVSECPAEGGARPGLTREQDHVAASQKMLGDAWEVEEMPVWAEEVRAFLGVKAPTVDLHRVLAAVLFTDIVGSTQRLTETGDAAWRSILARHDERARFEVSRYGGRYVGSTGDGLFATFDGPARAVSCAQAIAQAVADLGIQIRSGVHTGEVELDGDDVRGIAVHIGARVAALAGPSDVFVSQTVKDLVAGSGLTFEDAGEHELKGVPDRWHLYRVVG